MEAKTTRTPCLSWATLLLQYLPFSSGYSFWLLFSGLSVCVYAGMFLALGYFAISSILEMVCMFCVCAHSAVVSYRTLLASCKR